MLTYLTSVMHNMSQRIKGYANRHQKVFSHEIQATNSTVENYKYIFFLKSLLLTKDVFYEKIFY